MNYVFALVYITEFRSRLQSMWPAHIEDSPIWARNSRSKAQLGEVRTLHLIQPPGHRPQAQADRGGWPRMAGEDPKAQAGEGRTSGVPTVFPGQFRGVSKPFRPKRFTFEAS